ncbi:hypothetical protein [Limosilactobacillus oris]|uniref:hypothetical protein n=1 Tax=Limosilactobacillus oris TaxID=1632 RepID=UPI002236250A|nr:hypothetical protein [Limosilactobacillus oris]MCW4388643.1 hypothetical protein [Limosilactobacillus oris]
MKTVRILRWLELLLVVITCLYNFSPAIYQKLAGPAAHGRVFQPVRHSSLDTKLRNCGFALLVVTITEAGQLLWSEQR